MADNLSPPGTASYDSDTMVVGDGTWDFTKNSFLLPNLVGLNFDTMQYNGMGNRFSTVAQYHTLILAHGLLATIVFLFLVPIAILYARFYTRHPGYAIRYHAYLLVLAVLLTTVLFILGWFAVGPERSLTNPHHGIGVAIFTLILLQIIGGRFIKNIRGRSLRVMIHQWSGRAIALLGIAQVPLGLALYGSPKFTFILFALWMAFLVLLYFILSYRAMDRPDYIIRDGRSEITRTERTERKSSGGGFKWLGPLAAGAGALALLRGRKRETSQSRDRSRSRSHSRVSRRRSRSRVPEVLSTRRGSYVDEEKYTDRYTERPRKSSEGGIMNKVLGAGAALGTGALFSKFMSRRSRSRDDEEYSAVATDTPNRRRRSRSTRRHGGTVVTEYSDESEDIRRDRHRTPLLPGPGGAPAMAAAISAAESRQGAPRPITPRPSHHRPGASGIESTMDSDYSSYVSPSRRGGESSAAGPAGNGLLAGLGVGWFAKKMRDRRERKEEDRLRLEEEDRRAGQRESRYTGDGFSTPPRRRDSHREPYRTPTRPLGSPPGRPVGPPRAGTSMSHATEESSLIETRPTTAGFGPPMPPLPADGYAPPPPGVIPVPAGGSMRSRSRSRHELLDEAVMPPMPSDPHGVFEHESGSEAYMSSGGQRRSRRSSRHRQGTDEAAATAAATAGALAAEEEAQRRVERDGLERDSSRVRSPKSVSVKVKVHDDRDRNVTLRRLTEEEAMAARRERRRRSNSVSSLGSGSELPRSRQRYRRDSSSQRRAEESAEEAVAPMSPPAPAFAGGRRKDSAYYSGMQGGGTAGATPAAGATVSSLGSIQSPGSHGTWSGMSPATQGPRPEATASAADRRRRRRMERRDGAKPSGGTVDFT